MSMREWNPGELLEMSAYFWRTCALHAGVKTDVFSKIGSERLSAKNWRAG